MHLHKNGHILKPYNSNSLFEEIGLLRCEKCGRFFCEIAGELCEVDVPLIIVPEKCGLEEKKKCESCDF